MNKTKLTWCCDFALRLAPSHWFLPSAWLLLTLAPFIFELTLSDGTEMNLKGQKQNILTNFVPSNSFLFRLTVSEGTEMNLKEQKQDIWTNFVPSNSFLFLPTVSEGNRKHFRTHWTLFGRTEQTVNAWSRDCFFKVNYKLTCRHIMKIIPNTYLFPIPLKKTLPQVRWRTMGWGEFFTPKTMP